MTSERLQALALQCLGALLTATDEASSLLMPSLSVEQPEKLRVSAAIALCAAMREQISEEQLERLEQADVYPHAVSLDLSSRPDRRAEWISNQRKYLLALMSVTTSENRFIPQSPRILREYLTLFASAPEFPPLTDEMVRYPAWFNRYYTEDAIVMLLRFCFPASIPVQTRYADLNERQQRLLRLLAEHTIFWPDEGPYLRMQEQQQKREEFTKRIQELPEELRPPLPGFPFTQERSYEDELEASEMVQLLKQAGLPARREELQAYIRG